MQNVSAFICEQITNVPDRAPNFERNLIWIRCPYHNGGNERTPSFKINLDGSRFEVGTGYCYACKKRTVWNELADKLGVQQLKPSSLVHGVGTFSFNDMGATLPDLSTMLDWPEQDWRTINPSTLKDYGAKLELRHGEVYLYLPVHIRKTYVGGIHCAMSITKEEKADGKKAYLNVDGQWSATSVFGYNQAKRMRGPLIVVEGPRDTLRVAQLGGRVIGLLGAAVTPEKIKLITSLDPPYVIGLTDPDEAGDLAQELLKRHLQEAYIETIRVRLPEGKDAADLTKKSFRKVLDLAQSMFERG